MKFTQVIVFCILSIQLKALAVQADAQQWLNLTGQGLVLETKPFGFYLETQFRNSDRTNEIYESLFRPAIYYKTEEHGSFFIGTLSRLDNQNRQVEVRHWIQWLLQPKINDSDYRHMFRARLEQRIFEDNTEDSHRFRFMARTLHTSILGEAIRPFGSVELFYHLNRSSDNLRSGLSQTRTSLGLSVPMTSMTTFELSYLNMYIFNRKAEEQVNHVLNLTLNLNFN